MRIINYRTDPFTGAQGRSPMNIINYRTDPFSDRSRLGVHYPKLPVCPGLVGSRNQVAAQVFQIRRQVLLIFPHDRRTGMTAPNPAPRRQQILRRDDASPQAPVGFHAGGTPEADAEVGPPFRSAFPPSGGTGAGPSGFAFDSGTARTKSSTSAP
jgi:hypothetical protein